MIRVRGTVVSNGWWSTRHAKSGALNVLFDVVMKVLMFIELVSGVKYPKINTMGFVSKRPFVDVSSLCVLLFLCFCLKSFCFHFERNLFQPFFPSYMWIGEQGWTSKLFISSFPLKLVFNPAQPHVLHNGIDIYKRCVNPLAVVQTTVANIVQVTDYVFFDDIDRLINAMITGPGRRM